MPAHDTEATTILVTGAGGFVGAELCKKLVTRSLNVRAVMREIKDVQPGIESVEADLLALDTFEGICENVDCIVHLAGRAHVLRDESADPLTVYREVNCEMTLRLAQQAALSGVRRFIFISSIGVNGNRTGNVPFDERSSVNPEADYAISKFEAEEQLKVQVSKTNMELVIIRPPLIYGVNAPGNFGRLLKLVATGLPLPLGRINNKRSLVSIEDLVDFIGIAIHHPNAAGQLFLLSNGNDVSTTQIVRSVARGMGRSNVFFWIPDTVLRFAAGMVGKTGFYTQLYCSLQIDSNKARKLLGWVPSASTCSELEEIGRRYAALISKK